MSNARRLFGITLVLANHNEQPLGTFYDSLAGAQRLARALADQSKATLRLHHAPGTEATLPGDSRSAKLAALHERLTLSLAASKPLGVYAEDANGQFVTVKVAPNGVLYV